MRDAQDSATPEHRLLCNDCCSILACVPASKLDYHLWEVVYHVQQRQHQFKFVFNPIDSVFCSDLFCFTVSLPLLKVTNKSYIRYFLTASSKLRSTVPWPVRSWDCPPLSTTTWFVLTVKISRLDWLQLLGGWRMSCSVACQLTTAKKMRREEEDCFYCKVSQIECFVGGT